MNKSKKKQVCLKDELWKIDTEEKPRLIGSECEACGEIYFPKKEKNWCVHCQREALKEIELSREGKIVSYSVVMQQPGGGFYFGEVPYAYGQIDLPEKVRIITRFATDSFKKLRVGIMAELEIRKLYDDKEGSEVVTFEFRPKE